MDGCAYTVPRITCSPSSLHGDRIRLLVSTSFDECNSMPTATLEISGMSCDHCVSQIRECMVSRSGVGTAEVVLGRASIDFDEQVCSVADLVAAIHDVGRFQVASFSVRDSDA